MKQFIIAVAVIIAGISPAFGQDKNQKDTEQNIAQMERDYFKALSAGDRKTMERILAEDLTEVDDIGRIGTRQQILEGFTPGLGLTFEVVEMKNRVYDDAAVVLGTAVVKSKRDGKEQSEYFRYTNTYVKGKNGWQMVSSQYRIIPVWMARKMEDGELKPIAATECGQESGLKSSSSEVNSFVRFNNSTSKPVTLHWINFEGKRDPSSDQRQTIEPGKSVIRFTYLTHPFVITDTSGKCLGIYQPMREAGLVVIK